MIILIIILGAVVIAMSIFLLCTTQTVEWNYIPADTPNKYTDKLLTKKLNPLDEAIIQTYNYKNYDAASKKLTEYTPQTIGEISIMNNVVDYINKNGITEYVDYLGTNITVMTDR